MVKKQYIFSILLFVGIFYMLSTYAPVFIWAGVFACMIQPLMETYSLENKSISAFAYTAGLVVLILLPCLILLSIASSEIHSLIADQNINHVVQKATSTYINKIPYAKDMFSNINNYDWQSEIKDKLSFTTAKNSIIFFKTFASSVTQAIFCIIFFVLSVFYFLKNADRVKNIVENVIFNNIPDKKQLIQEVVTSSRSVFSALFATSIIVGLVMTPIFYFSKLPLPFFFGVVCAFLAVIPFTLPICYVMLFILCFINGNIIGGIVIIVSGSILNFITDSFIQPKIIQKKTKMHFFVALLGAIGGLETLGILGVFLGPVVINLGYIVLMKVADK